jgi:radical SAM/Cys-rich protein
MMTLQRQRNPLSDPRRQLEVLTPGAGQALFEQALSEHGLEPLHANGVEVLQINVGRACNQTCRHCHVDAGPDRREVMTRQTVQDCLDAVERAVIPTIDITGGAPELNPNFRWLVSEARRLSARVIDRCNLTILLAPGYQDLPEFLAGERVEIVASLPCYLAENTDAQRGEGVFEKSIEALRRLNGLGYGRPESGLCLTLVYNPVGPKLPPDQTALEAAYRLELGARYGIEFTRLLTITNMPISRFLDDLVRGGHYERYMETLVGAFNPAAVAGVMCRTTLSVGWDGRLFDCDFNQMLDLPLSPGLPRHIREFEPGRLGQRPVVTYQHCFGCTAGRGSGCQGAIVL